MDKEFSSIFELIAIREQKSRLTERERELTRPTLTDFSLIESIYEWFKEYIKGAPPAMGPNSPVQRRRFCFVIMALYSPSALAGGRMPNGLRKALQSLYAVKPCSISWSFRNAIFYYQQYKRHRQDVNDLYLFVLGKLKERESNTKDKDKD
jgi:hypothetical protein